MFQVLAFNPHPFLLHCVESYLIVSIGQPEDGYIENSFLPHTTQSLVIALKPDSRVYDCVHSEFAAPHFIVGPNDELCRVRLFPGLENMVVNFKPGGLFKIFRLPAHCFNNRSQNAEEFLGNQIPEISRRLGESELSGKIELMDNWLISHFQKQKKPDPNIDEAIRLIENNKGNISLRELELLTFTTKRTLERRFLEQVGLHPKTFSRIVRFNGVIRYAESNLNIKWRQLADAFGYYDQSHFIHEFKTLTGGLPQDYTALSARFENLLRD